MDAQLPYKNTFIFCGPIVDYFLSFIVGRKEWSYQAVVFVNIFSLLIYYLKENNWFYVFHISFKS